MDAFNRGAELGLVPYVDVQDADLHEHGMPQWVPERVRATLDAMRAHVGDKRVIAVLDPASNTMRSGVHKNTLGDALSPADAAA